MEPPPLPSASGRFRLRVQILPPQDAYNLSAAPLRQFTIVKTAALPLPDLTLQELCDEVVTRFKAIYPGESLFAIERPQDSYGSDLYLGDRVRDIFEDNEVFRVLKGATIRASVEPHRARSQSLQPSDVVTYESVGPEKRSYGYSETEDSLHVPKRQRMAVIKPDHPLRSREPDTVEPELQKPDEQRQEATVIQDSQASTAGDSSKQAVNALNQVLSKFRQTNPIQNSERTLMNQPPPIPASTSSAPSNRIPSPPSIISWRDEVINGGSNVHPRAGTRAKRKIYQIEEFSEQDGRQSVSTAVTTPLSALQSPNAHSPANDKKLRRPTMRPTKTSAEYKNVSRILPRKNVYEDIETDLEHPGAKSTAQTVHPGLGNPGTPQGVSLFKWKRGWSKTPSSDKSSPRQQRTATFESQGERNPNESRVDHEDQQHLTRERDEGIQVVKQRAEQERLRLAFEAAEKKRLEAKEAEDKLEAESEAERIVNEKLEEERQAELEKNRIAAERLRHEEEEKERVAAEKVRHQEAVKQAEAAAAAEAGAEAMRKRNSLAQAEAEMMAQLQTKAREEAKAREAAEAEGKRGNERQDMVRQEMEAIQKADEEDSLKEQALVRSRQEREHRKQELLMDTIRRGGRNGSKPGSCTPLIPRGRPSLFSPASASPSPKLPSLNVGLEAQMPLPPQIRRKVSFVDQQASSGRSSSATNTSFKQTTLVPPRIGNTGVRETPKRAQLKTYGKSSMLSKGKAKVVESPEKPAVPRREIKSDEDIIAESSGSEYLENNDQALGEPGPAYRRPMTRHTSSSSNSGVSTTPRLETARHGNSVREEAETSSSEKSKSSSPLGRNNMLVRQDKTNLIPEVHEPLARESKSTPIPLPKSRGSASKCGFSTQIRESLKKADSLTSDRSQKANIEPVDTALKNKAANEAADDTHEEPEPTKRNGDSKSQKALASSNKEQNDSPRLEIETQDEASDDSGEEVSSTEMHDNPKTANVVLAQVNKDPSNHRTQNVLDEITDEEQDEDSDGMQAEIDDQLLTQSFESTSSMKQLSIVPIKNKTPLKGNVDTNGFQNYTSGRPSLRRMNQEAQRTKQATLEAAKARGLERAQKMGNGVKRTGLLVNSEDTVSEFSSSEDDSEVETIARKTATDRTEVDRGDLDHEDAEEMGQQLIARENSGKLGWGKLGKQFGTKRYW